MLTWLKFNINIPQKISSSYHMENVFDKLKLLIVKNVWGNQYPGT